MKVLFFSVFFSGDATLTLTGELRTAEMERGRWRRDEGFWGVKEKGRENREMGRGDLEEGLAVKEIGEDDVAGAFYFTIE